MRLSFQPIFEHDHFFHDICVTFRVISGNYFPVPFSRRTFSRGSICHFHSHNVPKSPERHQFRILSCYCTHMPLPHQLFITLLVHTHLCITAEQSDFSMALWHIECQFRKLFSCTVLTKDFFGNGVQSAIVPYKKRIRFQIPTNDCCADCAFLKSLRSASLHQF